MSDGPSNFLSELTIPKLRAVAEEYGIDVSVCKHKKDLVEKLGAANVTEDMVSAALQKATPRTTESPTDKTEVKAIVEELQSIAERPSAPKELPEEEMVASERNIDQALLMRPSFFEVDSANERAWNRMVLGDFVEAIKINRDARSKMLASFSAYHVYSTALSIRAAETLLSGIERKKGGLDPKLKTALAQAKVAFISGQPRQREESLETLEDLTSMAYEAFIERSAAAEEHLTKLLSEFETFGTDTSEPKRLMEIAMQARADHNYSEYSRVLDEARERAEKARDARSKDIGASFPLVRAAVAEAREVGSDTLSDEAQLSEAKKAFEGNEFKRAADMLASIEKAVDASHLEKMKDQDAEARQFARVSSTVTTVEPDLEAAAAYGMDVQEGLVFVKSAKAALSNRDVVSAAKLTRLAKDVLEPVRKDLDEKMIEQGVMTRIEEAKCGRCGKESLYALPDDRRRCTECGHSFSFAQAPDLPVTVATNVPLKKPAARTLKAGEKPSADSKDDEKKEKKGLFKW